mmetsp:Transcript_89284/g.133863  ORF Transcript_89284/g.133863 Transcript_89284/m.133863 type:complete len:324 (-) Transcript_89284:40-1011(-)
MEGKWKDWTGSGAGSEWKDAFYTFTNEEEKVKPAEEIDTTRSWKDIEWDQKREESAKLVVQQEVEKVTQEEREKYETQAQNFWNEFYDKHNNNFFKPRNYLPAEFPELVLQPEHVSEQPKKKIVELGCGNGSSFYPLIDLYQNLSPRPIVYGLDFSTTAIEHIQNKDNYDSENSKAIVCDLVHGELPEEIRENQIDISLLLFVLSSIEPANMVPVLKKIFAALKPGGLLLFRDYGLYDMTQMRFVAKKKRKIDESFYVRADGTRTYFFDIEIFKEMALQAGFEIEKLKYDTREMKNRKRLLTMYRVWVTAKLRRPLSDALSDV